MAHSLLDTREAHFEKSFRKLLHADIERDAEISTMVRSILAEIRLSGDSAVKRFAQRFDKITAAHETLLISPDEIAEHISLVPEAEKTALKAAHARITAYHQHQCPKDVFWTDEIGAELGWRWQAIARVGLYVPGGTASYPSSVLMNAIPARLAGVKDIVMTTPAHRNALNPLVLYAAQLMGITEIYRIGGAQAIGALAYGTETICAVDKIVGPGNAYVAEAKRQVFGNVGIDMVAGPSEIVIIADVDNDPDWIAMDLLAQAEHDKDARAILLTDSHMLARTVQSAVSRLLKKLKRHEIAKKSWANAGAIILTQSLQEAVALSNRIAPEHLQLCTDAPETLLQSITNAGAIFLGKWTPEASGDYISGPSHVLPTAGAARFSSGLSVLDFMTRTSISRLNAAAFAVIGPPAATLARSEGLEAHARSIELRLQNAPTTPVAESAKNSVK